MENDISFPEPNPVKDGYIGSGSYNSRFLPTYSFCTHSPHIIRFIPSLSSIVNLATIPYLYITVVARYVAGVGHERGGHAVRSLCDVCLSRLRPFFLTSD